MIMTALIMSVANPGKAGEVIEKKETLLEASAASEKGSASGNEAISGNVNNNTGNISEKETEESGSQRKADVSEASVTVSVSENEAGVVTDISDETSDVSDNMITPPTIDPLPKGDEGFTVEGDVIEIKVISGDSSVSVSRRLFEAGLVESAVEFDKFLCENGYDKLIRVGTFTITEGSDFETIAHSLTGR